MVTVRCRRGLRRLRGQGNRGGGEEGQGNGDGRTGLKALTHRTNWVSVVARAEGIAFQRVLCRVPVRVR